MRGTRLDQIWADLANFSILQQNHSLYSIPCKWRCLVLGLASSTFYDVICLTERHDQFELQTTEKNLFCERCFFIHAYRWEACASFSLWNSLHHGRHKTVENKGSNIRYNKINITFSDWMIVENIISGNVIITFLRMICSMITQSGNVLFI